MFYELIIQISPEHEETNLFAIKHWDGIYGHDNNAMVFYQNALNIWEKLGGNRDIWNIKCDRRLESGAQLCLKKPHKLSRRFFKIILDNELLVKSGYTITRDEGKKEIIETNIDKVLDVVTELNSLLESSSEQTVQLRI
jgi:hypothetical protein